MKRKNVNITLAILAVAAAFILFCPLPYRVVCSLELKPRDSDPVYAKVPGTLVEISTKVGRQVKTGDKLGQLKSIDLELEIADLQAKIAQQEDRMELLQYEQGELQNEIASLEMPRIKQMLAALRDQLSQREEDRKRLELVAPANGTVLPAPDVPSRPERDRGDLAKWSGSPLEKKNLGAYLAPPAVYCQIGDPHRWEAILAIDQDDIEFLHPDQSVAIKLDECRTARTTARLPKSGRNSRSAQSSCRATRAAS